MAKRSIRVQDLAAAGRRLYQLGEGVERAANILTSEYAIAVIASVGAETPVDTGKARSNWRVSINHTLSGVIKPHSPYPSRWKAPYGSGGGKGETANLNAAINLAKTRLAQYKGGTIVIANNVPYINRLNAGHSNLSAPGWIEKAMASATRNIAPKVKDLFEKEMVK